ncbi:MAG: iron ABC transporter permease [Oscillospiraceae bacterium]|nr:iron ABC transporter permease [Oscillospiraceae bacterium]
MGSDAIKRGLFRGRPLYLITVLALLIVLPLSILAAVTFGTMRLPMGEVYQVIRFELGRIFLRLPIPEEWAPGTPIHDVVWLIRLPRLVLAAAVGVSLSISGVIMQAIVKNPLADPYILGISSGASLGATVAVMLGVGLTLGSNYVGIMAFLGAFCVSMAVIALANVGGRATSVKLLLAGSALSAVCGAFSSFIIYIAHDDHSTGKIVNWTMGSLAAADWENNAAILAVALAGTLFFLTQYRTLNLMLLGDDSAITLGTDLHRRRVAYLVVSSLMVGFAVYNAGVIGFVGLVVPHGARMLFGTDHKKLIPISALAGAVFLVWADVLCRTILPGNEMPVGILTSILGAPVFIYLMARKKYGFGA